MRDFPESGPDPLVRPDGLQNGVAAPMVPGEVVNNENPEDVFERVVIWQPWSYPVPVDVLVEGMSDVDRGFIMAVYRLAQNLYGQIPMRKNGEAAFTHPTNVAMYLKRARCQPYVIAAGLLHDFIEERVDLEKAAIRSEIAARIKAEVTSRINARIRAELTASMNSFDVRDIAGADSTDRVETARRQVRVDLATQTRAAIAQPDASILLNDEIGELVKQEMGRVSLSDLENAIRGDFGREINRITDRTGFPRHVAARVVETVWLLTRHKSDLYYRSISGIFINSDLTIRVAAALVKLADRMHNIQTIDNYESSEKLYQCFKNLFILNNSQQLLATRSESMDWRMSYSLDKMFKKSGKALFEALHNLAHTADSSQKVFKVVSYLALALRKYIHEQDGLARVNQECACPGAPVHAIFDGIVIKYDHRLHGEMDAFLQQQDRELGYMRATFGTLGLSDDDLREAVAYKDAMALLEVVGMLVYRKDFMILDFQCSALCRRGQMCTRRAAGPENSGSEQD